MTMNQSTDPHSDLGSSIEAKDVFRVIIFTLLIMLVGFFIISTLGVFSVLQDQGIDTPAEMQELVEEINSSGQEIPEWLTQGLADLPLPMKVGSVFVQFSLILPAYVTLRRKNLSIQSHLRLRAVHPQLLVYPALIGITLAIVGDELSRLVHIIMPMSEEQILGIERALAIDSVSDFLTMGLTVVLIAPIVEEALFRGFFQRWFERHRGVTSGVLTTSALFAAYHFNIYWLIPILIMATILGAMAWRTDSILPPIIVHAVNNSIGLIASNVYNNEDPSWYALGDHVAPWVFLIALGVMIWSLRQFFILAERTQDL